MVVLSVILALATGHSVIVSQSGAERYQTSNCWFCAWYWWTWKSKFPTTKRKTNRTVSHWFPYWASKPLPWGSHCGGVRPTYKYCTGQILIFFWFIRLKVIRLTYLIVKSGYSTRSRICQKDWSDCSSWWKFLREWKCQSSSRGKCEFDISLRICLSFFLFNLELLIW